jgi:uncharacterized protein (DUF924 family)
MGYILKKYGKNNASQERIKQIWDKSLALEARLFAYLPFQPDQLKAVVAQTTGPKRE